MREWLSTAQKRILTRIWPCWHTVLGLNTSRTVRNKFLLHISHAVYGILILLPENTRTHASIQFSVVLVIMEYICTCCSSSDMKRVLLLRTIQLHNIGLSSWITKDKDSENRDAHPLKISYTIAYLLNFVPLIEAKLSFSLKHIGTLNVCPIFPENNLLPFCYSSNEGRKEQGTKWLFFWTKRVVFKTRSTLETSLRKC